MGGGWRPISSINCLVMAQWSTIKGIQIKTVTHDIATAPYLAVKCLQKVSEMYKDQYSKASEIIKNNFYRDVLMTGGNKISELLENQEIILEILNTHGFYKKKSYKN